MLTMFPQALLTILFCFGFILLYQTPAQAGKGPQDLSTFAFYFENDTFIGTDREYTAGIKLTWIFRDLSDPPDKGGIRARGHSFFDGLPFVHAPGFRRNLSLSLGQSVYTPDDLTRRDLIEDQRPYAGVMYLSLGVHRKNDRWMDTLEFTLGILGPNAYAEDVQRTVHEWIDSDIPEGWEHQLKDEPILNIFFERKWRAIRSQIGRGFAYDVIPYLGCSLGNAFVKTAMGGQYRFGWNLPSDFGTFPIRPGSDTHAPMDERDPRISPSFSRIGIHVFAGVDIEAVLRNIVLDGNTLRDSHRVDKKHFVVQAIAGIGIVYYRWKLSFAYVHRTREYETQKRDHAYGSLALSWSL